MYRVCCGHHVYSICFLLGLLNPSQEPQDVESMLDYRRSSVVDGGLALTQH